MKRTLIMSIVLYLILSVSCKKENDVKVEIDTLTLYNWHLVKMQLNVRNPIAPEYNMDTTMYPKDCEKDDYRKFLSDSTYVQYYGTNKCDMPEPDSVTGTWSYNKSNHILILYNETSGTETYKIYELDNGNLILIQESSFVATNGNRKVTISSKRTYYYENK